MSTPRLALQRKEAAEALGISGDTFDRHVRPHLRCVYVGATRLWRVADLDAWLEREAKELGSLPTTQSAPALVEQPGA